MNIRIKQECCKYFLIEKKMFECEELYSAEESNQTWNLGEISADLAQPTRQSRIDWLINRSIGRSMDGPTSADRQTYWEC
jgi:hypothetical protein